MKPAIHLSIATPCRENWDQMTAVTNGRFCGSCQKTVMDFTAMDDHELLEWFATREGPVCGRLRPEQLGRPLVARPEPQKTRWLHWNYLLAGLLFSSEAIAQTKPVKPPVSHHVPVRSDIPESIAAVVDPKISTTVDKIPAEHRPTMEDYLTPLEGAVGGISVGIPIVHGKRQHIVTDTLSLFKDTLALAGLTKPALTAYPNPVARGTSLTISVRLDQKGYYSLQLFNAEGALLESREIDRSLKTDDLTLPVSATLAPGIYFLKLSHPAMKGCYSQQIMVY